MTRLAAVSLTLASVFALGSASPTWGLDISPGESVDFAVPGTTEIYRIFGHPRPDAGSTPAIQIDFVAGAGNIFTVSAAGITGCCGGLDPSFTPDGRTGGMNITAVGSGLSGLSGDSQIPLVGAFVDADPFGNAPPAALVFDKDNPTSLSPLLNQVFYLGDGRGGFNNPAGAILEFTAPASATKLFVGVIDAFGFVGDSSFYFDNPGGFEVTVSLLRPPSVGVPEPATLTLLGLGLAGLLGALRRRRP